MLFRFNTQKKNQESMEKIRNQNTPRGISLKYPADNKLVEQHYGADWPHSIQLC